MVNEPTIAGETPWRDNLIDLPLQPSIDQVLEHPDIGFDVKTTPMYYLPPGEGMLEEEEGRAITFRHSVLRRAETRAVIRTDTGRHLGTVKKGYTPYQNSELFNLLRPAIESKALTIDMVGSIKGGKRVFCLAKVNRSTTDIIPGDPMKNYICFGNGHDGSMSVFRADTNIRVVCTNVLTTIMNTERSTGFRVQHSRKVSAKVIDVWSQVDASRKSFEGSVELYRALAKRDINSDDFQGYVRGVFGKKQRNSVSKDDREAEKTRVDNVVEQIEALFESGRGTEIPGVRGTWWGAFNSVTEYLNYERGRLQSARFEGLLFGEGNRLANKALQSARELALA